MGNHGYAYELVIFAYPKQPRFVARLKKIATTPRDIEIRVEMVSMRSWCGEPFSRQSGSRRGVCGQLRKPTRSQDVTV
jgi:hypothetical protein